jgi:hypothetical protein
VLTASAGLAGAVAGGGRGGSPDGAAVARAADATSSQDTLRMRQLTSTSVAGRSFTVVSDGAFDARRQRAHATLDLSSLRPLAPRVLDKLGGAGALRGEMVVDRGLLDVRLGVLRNGLTRVLHRDPGEWAQVDVVALGRKVGVDLGPLVNGATPSRDQAVGYLKALTSKLKNLGSETVDGTPTTHYRGTLDFEHLPGKGIPPASRKTLTQVAQLLKRTGASTKVPVDVWIDRHHLVRRETVKQSINGTQTTTTTVFSDYGKPVDVRVPARTYDLVEVIDQVAPGGLSRLGALSGAAK